MIVVGIETPQKHHYGAIRSFGQPVRQPLDGVANEEVFAAYGWSPDIGDQDLLAKLLALNLERAPAGGSAAADTPLDIDFEDED